MFLKPSNLANNLWKLAFFLPLPAAGLLLASARAEEPQTAAEQSNEPIQQPIQQWAAGLDSDEFDIRERAQQQLEIAELPALEAVAKTAQTGSLESSTRAINVLLFWAESKNQKLQLAALQKLANLPHRPREAAMATRLLANAREQAAIETLTKLGATVTPVRNSSANVRVRIGPQWKGGDEGLKHLADVPHANHVCLHVAPLTDPALEHLTSLDQIQVLELYSIDFSEAAILKLQQQLPNTKIVSKSGPMLGISGNANDMIKTSVGVGGVVKNSAASKAGIRRGDRITEFNGEPVTEFTALTDRIAKYQPGDTAKLTLLRENKTQEVSVTFDKWGENDSNQIVQQLNLRGRIQIQGLPVQINQPRQRR